MTPDPRDEELASIPLDRTFWRALTELLRRKAFDGVGPVGWMRERLNRTQYSDELGGGGDEVGHAVRVLHADWLRAIEDFKRNVKRARSARLRHAREARDAEEWLKEWRARGGEWRARWESYAGARASKDWSDDVRTAHAVLNIVPGTNADEVKRVYRNLTLRLHPDLNPGDAEKAAKMVQVNIAYELVMTHLEKHEHGDDHTTNTATNM